MSKRIPNVAHKYESQATDLLKRKKIKKELLFKYLHSKRVPIESAADKVQDEDDHHRGVGLGNFFFLQISVHYVLGGACKQSP